MAGDGDPSLVLRPGNIVLDSVAPERLAEFWATLTGYEHRELFEPYVGLRDPSGTGPHLSFQRVERPPAPGGGRCHLDFYVPDPDGLARRAEASGARRLDTVQEGDTHWIVMADPEGNQFCLVAAVGPDRHR